MLPPHLHHNLRHHHLPSLPPMGPRHSQSPQNLLCSRRPLVVLAVVLLVVGLPAPVVVALPAPVVMALPAPVVVALPVPVVVGLLTALVVVLAVVVVVAVLAPPPPDFSLGPLQLQSPQQFSPPWPTLGLLASPTSNSPARG